jgi:hypothetical protein
MTKAEALQNTFETLRVHRMTQGEPPTITINCGDAGKAEIITGWSKSSVNTTQTVFLVIPDSDETAAMMPSAKTIYWGEVVFVVRGQIEPPTEPGGYWLLPVREA